MVSARTDRRNQICTRRRGNRNRLVFVIPAAVVIWLVLFSFLIQRERRGFNLLSYPNVAHDDVWHPIQAALSTYHNMYNKTGETKMPHTEEIRSNTLSSNKEEEIHKLSVEKAVQRAWNTFAGKNESLGDENLSTKNVTNTVLKESDICGSELSLEIFQQVGASLARPFIPWANYTETTWCHKRLKSYFRQLRGMFFMKTPKAASSTCVGVARRIAARYNKTSHDDFVCAVQAHHVTHYRARQVYGPRDRGSSFLWTSVRDPATRAVSRFFFTHVSIMGNDATDDKMIMGLRSLVDSQYGTISPGMGGFQLAYLSHDTIGHYSAWNYTNPTKVLNATRVQEHVQNVVNDYDFILVVERMDESLVALQLLLDLDPGDVLYVSSKTSGGYAYFQKRCVNVQKSFVSPLVASYLKSAEWYARNYGDYLLHAAANKSLDLTIDRLGRARFEDALQEHRRLKGLVNEKCAPVAVFPCSAEGVVQTNLSDVDCYKEDEGCGYRCINDLMSNMKE